MSASVIEVMTALQKLSSFELDVRPERCVRMRNRHASCSRCFDACTSGALALVDGEPLITPESCVGCGTCATVCPTGALEAQHPNDAVLLAAARVAAANAQGTVVFACKQVCAMPEGQQAAGACVELTCLSRVEESLVATLFSEGFYRIVMVHGTCESCERDPGIESARLVERTLSTLIDAWQLPCSCTLTNHFPVEACSGCDENTKPQAEVHYTPATVNEGVHRDSTTAPVTLAHVMEDGTLPHFVPTRRNRLLDALGTFGDPGAQNLDTRLWGHITIDLSKCRSCRMCAVFCPTGALSRFTDEDGQIGIEHYVAECVHCKLCQDICPEGAITSASNVPALQLAHAETERYPMPEPVWHTGPDQILRKMQPQISGNEVRHSYG